MLSLVVFAELSLVNPLPPLLFVCLFVWCFPVSFTASIFYILNEKLRSPHPKEELRLFCGSGRSGFSFGGCRGRAVWGGGLGAWIPGVSAEAGVPVLSRHHEHLWPWVAKELFSLAALSARGRAESYLPTTLSSCLCLPSWQTVEWQLHVLNTPPHRFSKVLI